MKIKGFRRNVEQEFGEHAHRYGPLKRLQARGSQRTKRKSKALVSFQASPGISL